MHTPYPLHGMKPLPVTLILLYTSWARGLKVEPLEEEGDTNTTF